MRGTRNDVAAANIHIVSEEKSDGLICLADLLQAFVRNDLLHSTDNARRTDANGVAGLDEAAGDPSGKSTESEIVTIDPLHGHSKRSVAFATPSWSRFEPIQQSLSRVPRHVSVVWLNHVLAFQGRDRDCRDRLKTEILGKAAISEVDFLKNFPGPLHQIHFVDC